MIKKIIILSVISIITISCKETVTKSLETRDGEPDVHFVNSTNNSMNDAIERAKSTFSNFKNAYDSNDEKFSNFIIKQKFETPSGNGEHMWIGEIHKYNGSLKGVLQNNPVEEISIQYGDTLEINIEKISDWMYFENGFVRGAYTLRVLRNELSEKEQIEFDYESGLIFDN